MALVNPAGFPPQDRAVAGIALVQSTSFLGLLQVFLLTGPSIVIRPEVDGSCDCDVLMHGIFTQRHDPIVEQLEGKQRPSLYKQTTILMYNKKL